LVLRQQRDRLTKMFHSLHVFRPPRQRAAESEPSLSHVRGNCDRSAGSFFGVQRPVLFAACQGQVELYAAGLGRQNGSLKKGLLRLARLSTLEQGMAEIEVR